MSKQHRIKTIAECCDILDNFRVPMNDEVRQTMQGNVPYYGANGIQGYIDKFIFDEDLILLAEDGGNFEEYNTRPIAYKIDGKSWVNNHAHILRAKENFNQDYIFYALVHKDITKYLNSGTMSKLNKSELEKIVIEFPATKDEEDKISKILTTADTIIEKTQAAIAKYKAIKQGMLQDLFTRGIDITTNKLRPRYEDVPQLYKESKLGWIPRGWDEKIIDNVAKVNGRVGWKGYTVNDLRETGPLALGATHIDKENKLNLENPIHLSMEKYLESPEIMVRFGEILIVQRGTIGKIVIIDREIGDATINPSMVLLNNIRTNNFFLYYQLCSFIGQRQIELLTTQTGVPMISQKQIKNINLGILKNAKEAEAIAERLNSIENIIRNEQSFLLKQRQIKKVLMEDLLTGKKLVKAEEELITQNEN